MHKYSVLKIPWLFVFKIRWDRFTSIYTLSFLHKVIHISQLQHVSPKHIRFSSGLKQYELRKLIISMWSSRFPLTHPPSMTAPIWISSVFKAYLDVDPLDDAGDDMQHLHLCVALRHLLQQLEEQPKDWLQVLRRDVGREGQWMREHTSCLGLTAQTHSPLVFLLFSLYWTVRKYSLEEIAQSWIQNRRLVMKC